MGRGVLQHEPGHCGCLLRPAALQQCLQSQLGIKSQVWHGLGGGCWQSCLSMGEAEYCHLLPGTWITDLAGWWLKAVPSCFFLVFDCLKGLTHYSKPLKWISTLVATVHFRCMSALSQTPALDNLGFSSCILQNELFFLPCPELHEIALCREVLLLFHPTPEAPRSFTPALHWKVTREWWMQ